jgi:hypothetical protein
MCGWVVFNPCLIRIGESEVQGDVTSSNCEFSNYPQEVRTFMIPLQKDPIPMDNPRQNDLSHQFIHPRYLGTVSCLSFEEIHEKENTYVGAPPLQWKA